MVQSLLTAASASQAQAILPPQPPELEFSGAISAHCNLCLLGSKTGFHHVAQADFELLTSSDPPASAFQNAEITGMNHCAWPSPGFFLRMRPSPLRSPAIRMSGFCKPNCLTLSSTLECSGAILAHCNLCLLSSKTGFCHVGQAGLKFLTSGDAPALASQSAGITGLPRQLRHENGLNLRDRGYKITPWHSSLDRVLPCRQSVMQWHDLGSLQPPPPGFKQFSASASRVAGIMGAHQHAQLVFVFLVEGGFTILGRLVGTIMYRLHDLFHLALEITEPSPVLALRNISSTLAAPSFPQSPQRKPLAKARVSGKWGIRNTAVDEWRARQRFAIQGLQREWQRVSLQESVGEPGVC
ncbi:hypothetical protein AAY473_022612 [Plecturocebus cupreus]